MDNTWIFHGAQSSLPPPVLGFAIIHSRRIHSGVTPGEQSSAEINNLPKNCVRRSDGYYQDAIGSKMVASVP